MSMKQKRSYRETWKREGKSVTVKFTRFEWKNSVLRKHKKKCIFEIEIGLTCEWTLLVAFKGRLFFGLNFCHLFHYCMSIHKYLAKAH